MRNLSKFLKMFRTVINLSKLLFVYNGATITWYNNKQKYQNVGIFSLLSTTESTMHVLATRNWFHYTNTTKLTLILGWK